MDTSTKTRKKPIIIAAVAALIIGAVLGAVGYAVWESSRPEPLFSFDPNEITEVGVESTSGGWGAGDSVTITDREKIEQIVELLNNFTYDSTDSYQGDIMGWSNRIILPTARGISYVYFYTHDNGEPDGVTIRTPDELTAYMTTPGYFWPIAEMCGA